MMMENASLSNLLMNNVVKVVFTKKDGTERVMYCTKDLSRIPDNDHPKGTSDVKRSDEVERVYDIENGWRSFRKDSVIDWMVV